MSLTLSNVQLQEFVQKCRSSIRPWSEFVNARKFALPAAAASGGKRILRNLDLYYSNYFIIFLVFLTFAILTSPILLLAIGACLGVCYYIKLKNKDKTVTIMGRELNAMQQYSAIMLMSVPLLWLLGAGAAFSWVVGSTIVLTLLHAVMFNSDDIAKITDINIEHV